MKGGIKGNGKEGGENIGEREKELNCLKNEGNQIIL